MSIPAKVLDAAARAIESAIAAGDINDNGVGIPTVGNCYFKREEVATVLLYLAAGPVQEARHIPREGVSSYTWKHRVESWGRLLGFSPYVSNGAFIVAADWLGIPSRRIAGSPNVAYALKHLLRDVDEGYHSNHCAFGHPSWESVRETRQLVARGLLKRAIR